MAILKHDIPILEFDSASRAVIDPTHENLRVRLPKKCVFPFLGDRIEDYAMEHGLWPMTYFVSATKRFPVFVTEHKGEKITLCQAPVGAAAAAQLMDWLIGYGVEQIISAGTCGALKAFEEGVFLVPCKALRDEGTSYHYAPPSRFFPISKIARNAIEQALREHGLEYKEVTTWTTDGFYRETPDLVAYRKEEGCEVVEMECAALAACAAFRGAEWGMILYTADSLADAEKYDMRNWGGDANDYALKLCLDAVFRF